METKGHWESVYETKAVDAVSWCTPHLYLSLANIKRTGLPASAAVIDVGGGEATLVGDLIGAGYSDLTLLDISSKAPQVCQQRLGARANAVHWFAADDQKYEAKLSLSSNKLEAKGIKLTPGAKALVPLSLKVLTVRFTVK